MGDRGLQHLAAVCHLEGSRVWGHKRVEESWGGGVVKEEPGPFFLQVGFFPV
jgi:hypothetical protein